MKKALSVLLAFLLAISLLPAPALAEENLPLRGI
jgi:putative cell wall-binding protein